MVNRAKQIGSQFERDVVAEFHAHGHKQVERRFGAGAAVDKGDLQGFARRCVSREGEGA